MTIHARILAASGAVLAAFAVHASPVVNGSFESGDLAGWTAVDLGYGDGAPPTPPTVAIADGAPYDPLQGNHSVLLVAMNLDGDHGYSCAENPFTFGCSQPLPFVPGLGSGLAYGLDGVMAPRYMGAAIGQNLTVAANEALSWEWGLYGETGSAYGAGWFYATNGTAHATIAAGNDGSQSFRFTEAGLWTVYFGVAQAGDPYGWGGLMVDGVQLRAVPEPGSLAVCIVGLLGLAASVRRRKDG